MNHKTLISTDVLVVGGGSAGFAAALAAKRMNVDVTIVEKDGSFGGLWTNGLVLRLYGTSAKDGDNYENYYGGIGRELNQRLKQSGHLLLHGDNDFEPTPDPEAVIHYMDEMLCEAGVKIILRAYAIDVIIEDTTVKGVVFASKQGKFAVMAKVVIDTTGDGDIFSMAGAEFNLFDEKIGLNHLLGNVNKADPNQLSKYTIFEPTPNESIAWVNMGGDTSDFSDIIKLTELELRYRKNIWDTTEKIKQNESCKDIYILRTATQLGLRMTRSIKGLHKLTHDEARQGMMFEDNIAVSGWSHYCTEFKSCGGWGIPYRILITDTIGNLLTAGRCVSADRGAMHELRLIPNCIRTGQAAGVAAALAHISSMKVQDICIKQLQEHLLKQEVILG